MSMPCVSLAAEPEDSSMEDSLVLVAQKMRKAGVVQFNFSNIDIATFMRFMSELLQENIIVSPDLTQRISIISPKPIPLSDARQLMLSILAMHNLSLQEMGSYSIIVPGPDLVKSERKPEVTRQYSMIAVTPDGLSGLITQEDLNNLMMNTFEETRKVRTRPKFEGNEPIGIEIQWIYSDSILGKNGIVAGDVLKSVNGIPITNIVNITNALKSLMSVTKFDVEVLRGNAPINLACVILAAEPEDYPSIEEDDLFIAAQKMREEGMAQFSFSNVNIATFIRFMSELLQENIVFTSRLTQKISIVSLEPIPLSQARQTMLSVLAMHNLSLLEMGSYSILSVVPEPVSVKSDPQPEDIHQSNMIAAAPDGQAGVITQEDLNKLMMNPFEEMRKFRLRPKFEGNEPVGIEIQWIQNDSILGKLGVVKGDVLKSVNGIPTKNMDDITKAVNALMNGTRFDVEVIRDNAPINLTYMVR
jgi:type II secretory pathway component PulC